MSLRLMVQVMDGVEVTRPQQAVLLAMADHANDEGKNCFPSVDRIAWKSGYKPRAVEDIMRGLRQAKIIVEVAPARAKKPTEYEIRLENAPMKKPFEEWQMEHGKHRTGKGACPAPVQSDVSGVQSDVSGVQSDVSGVQSDEKSARENAPEPSGEPSEEPSGEPVVGETETKTPIPDDTTTICLRLLLKVKGFPRDQGDNAIKLAEYREEFPNVDPLEVIRDFKAYCEETQKPATRLRLRNFFKQATKPRPGNKKPDAMHQGGMNREERAARRSKGRPERKPDRPGGFDPERIREEWERRKREGRIGLADAS